MRYIVAPYLRWRSCLGTDPAEGGRRFEPTTKIRQASSEHDEPVRCAPRAARERHVLQEDFNKLNSETSSSGILLYQEMPPSR